jgi:hypothetical protein
MKVITPWCLPGVNTLAQKSLKHQSSFSSLFPHFKLIDILVAHIMFHVCSKDLQTLTHLIFITFLGDVKDPFFRWVN